MTSYKTGLMICTKVLIFLHHAGEDSLKISINPWSWTDRFHIYHNVFHRAPTQTVILKIRNSRKKTLCFPRHRHLIGVIISRQVRYVYAVSWNILLYPWMKVTECMNLIIKVGLTLSNCREDSELYFFSLYIQHGHEGSKYDKEKSPL